jgi:hypothetical protein
MSAEIEETRLELSRGGLQHLVRVGALAVGEQPPAAYRLAQARQQEPQTTPAVPNALTKKTV